jgi:hypothetical protein
MAVSPLSRAYLLMCGLAWFAYGVCCLVHPSVLELMCGMRLASDVHWGFLTEVQAMYGGLQMGFGATALLSWHAARNGCTRQTQQRVIETLRSFAVIMTVLGLVRGGAILQRGKSLECVGGLCVRTARPACTPALSRRQCAGQRGVFRITCAS